MVSSAIAQSDKWQVLYKIYRAAAGERQDLRLFVL